MSHVPTSIESNSPAVWHCLLPSKTQKEPLKTRSSQIKAQKTIIGNFTYYLYTKGPALTSRKFPRSARVSLGRTYKRGPCRISRHRSRIPIHGGRTTARRFNHCARATDTAGRRQSTSDPRHRQPGYSWCRSQW